MIVHATRHRYIDYRNPGVGIHIANEQRCYRSFTPRGGKILTIIDIGTWITGIRGWKLNVVVNYLISKTQTPFSEVKVQICLTMTYQVNTDTDGASNSVFW